MPVRAYRTEHLATVPRGYHVRTVDRGEHRVRIAFPPGPRRRGAGKVVEILHPLRENPCRMPNPAELLVMTNPAELLVMTNTHNPGKKAKLTGEENHYWTKIFETAVGMGKTPSQADREAWSAVKREFPRLRGYRGAQPNPGGSPQLYDQIRRGDRVTVVTRMGQHFTGKAYLLGPAGWVLGAGPHGSRMQIASPENVIRVSARRGNPSPKQLQVWDRHLLKIAKDTLKMPDAMAGVMGGMTKAQAKEIIAKLGRKSNPDAEERAGELYTEFHGHAPQHVDEYTEPSPRGVTLTELGDLIELKVKCDAGWKERSLNFPRGSGDDVVKLASNPAGSQLYLVGGNQRLRSFAPFGADRSKELVDLGECTYIAYRAKKTHVNGIASDYEHFFGEENDVRPRLMFDRRTSRLSFAGGNYTVKPEGIVN